MAGRFIQSSTEVRSFDLLSRPSNSAEQALDNPLFFRELSLGRKDVRAHFDGLISNKRPNSRLFSAAVVRVEIVKEDFGFANGHNSLTLTVTADGDVADVQKRLAALVADKSLQGKIEGQQQQIRQLAQQVQTLNSRLSVAPDTSTGALRKERNIAFGNIEELDSKKLAASCLSAVCVGIHILLSLLSTISGMCLNFLCPPAIHL
jgi:hypothetical protein